MRFISASKIFTVSHDPIENGVIILDDAGEILEVMQEVPDVIGNRLEFFEGYITPGFVNTHCHLELSHLKNKLPQHKGLHKFIRNIEQFRNATEEEISEAAKRADKEMYKNGIVAVGDIANTNHSLKTKSKSKLFYHTFFEVFAFSEGRAELAFEKGQKNYNEFLSNSAIQKKEYTASIVPHAPYSVSDKLMKLINDFAEHNESVLTIHNQENIDENKLFLNKTGKFIEHFAHFGIDITDWKAPKTNSIISALRNLKTENNLILVHNTYTSQEDIDFVNKANPNAYWCLCPNANLYIEKTLPDINLFFKNNCKITLGTDSLASNTELSIFSEIQTIMKHHPKLEFEEILEWATINGAEALKIDEQYGSIEKGKKPGLVLISKGSATKLSVKRIV